MAKIDKQKRAWGGAIKRTKPSKAATVISEHVKGRVLDYGCGHGFDANHFGWESFDPYYGPKLPDDEFDTIVCINVANALSRNNRSKLLSSIQEKLSDEGAAYIAVPRNIPKTGKLGIHHSLQNYVVLTLPLLFEDDQLAIYVFAKDASFKDKTKEYMTPRDRRASK